MKSNRLPPVQDPRLPDQVTQVTNQSTGNGIWKPRLAVAEALFCIIVPCIGLLLWSICDQEFYAALGSGSQQESLNSGNSIFDMVPIDADTVLAVSRHGQLRFWDLTRQAASGEIQSHLEFVHCAAFSQKQNLLAVGSMFGELEIWDLEHPGKPIASFREGRAILNVCEFTSDGSLLCSAGESCSIEIWDPRTMRRLGQLSDRSMQEPIRSLAFTSDGEYLLAGDQQGRVHIWDVLSRRLVQTLNATDHSIPLATDLPNCYVEALLILPGDREVVAVTRSSGISVWDISTGTCVRRWRGSAEAIRSATLAGEGRQLITGNLAGEIETWETSSGRRLTAQATHVHPVRALASNGAGTVVIFGDFKGKVECRDIR